MSLCNISQHCNNTHLLSHILSHVLVKGQISQLIMDFSDLIMTNTGGFMSNIILGWFSILKQIFCRIFLAEIGTLIYCSCLVAECMPLPTSFHYRALVRSESFVRKKIMFTSYWNTGRHYECFYLVPYDYIYYEHMKE